MAYTSLTHTTLEAIVPSNIQKYVVGNDGSAPIISTLWSKENMMVNLDLGTPPEGWTKVEHPDSSVYYVHEANGVLTRANVLDSNICDLIMDTAEKLCSAMQALLDDRKADLVLDVHVDEKTTKISYYCVFHTKRRVFWLHGMGHGEVDVPCTTKKCTETLKVHCIEAQYWKHCEIFPTTFTVSGEVARNLKGILIQTAADTLLFKSSTSPYGKEDLEYMLNLVKEIEEMARDQRGSGYSSWVVAKLMALHNDDALRNSHSQSSDHYQPPRLLAILRPLLRGVPEMYAARLESFRGDSIREGWLDFIHGIDKNMRDTYLLATVLLSTNAGLLAWTGASNPTINAPRAEQILAYISIICSYGSVAMGFAFFKPFRMVATNVPPRVLRSRDVPYGLERIAVLLSLPDVLLAWGMDAFLAAFCIIFYKETGIQVRVPTTVALCFVFLCKAYPTYAFRPSRARQEVPRRESSV